MLDVWLLVVLLVSSLTEEAAAFGLLRSSFIGLHRLRQDGLDTDNGSNDIWSSTSMEPENTQRDIGIRPNYFTITSLNLSPLNIRKMRPTNGSEIRTAFIAVHNYLCT